MDIRNTDDSNLFVPNEMNKTQLPTYTTTIFAFSIFTYYFKMY